jgi:hypothetical protein
VSKPLLFISHKHDDKALAERIAKFVRTITGGQVDVFLSSNPGFDGIRVGKPITEELKDALYRAGVVLLVYTSQDNDWSWCMWECGLADEPSSPDTKVIVIQCLPDKPTVFEGKSRVQAWEEDSLVNLAKRFLEAGFFPDFEGPFTGLKEPELASRAEELHEDLVQLIPSEPPENWSAWPFMRLEMPRDKLDVIGSGSDDETTRLMRDALLENAVILDTASGLPGLFGSVDISGQDTKLERLVDDWTEKYPEREPEWLDSLSRQILEASRKKVPKAGSWARFRRVGGAEEYVIGVGRAKKDLVRLTFDCYFFGVGAVDPVESRMTRRDKMYCVDLSSEDAADKPLVDLVAELEKRQWNRIPILDGSDPRYIIHLSMIDRFIREKSLAGLDATSLSLADLLADDDMRDVFQATFGLVRAGQTIADALIVMRDTPGCVDLFVTDDTKSVVGWLTDKDIRPDELRTL